MNPGQPTVLKQLRSRLQASLEFALRFTLRLGALVIYNLRFEGRDLLPQHGAAVIVANHVSFIDWLVLTAACRRPIRFVMDHRIFATPGIGLIFKLCHAIPIAPGKEDPAMKEQAFGKISAALRAGEMICIFPEGIVTRDGELSAFRPGIERILSRDEVPVIPVAISGLWGSFFSRKDGGAMQKMPKPTRRTIRCRIDAPIEQAQSAGQLEARVRSLLNGAG